MEVGPGETGDLVFLVVEDDVTDRRVFGGLLGGNLQRHVVVGQQLRLRYGADTLGHGDSLVGDAVAQGPLNARVHQQHRRADHDGDQRRRRQAQPRLEPPATAENHQAPSPLNSQTDSSSRLVKPRGPGRRSRTSGRIATTPRVW